MEKPSSLDLLCMPPTITVTPNNPPRNPHQYHQHHHHQNTDTTTTISDSSDADLNHPGNNAANTTNSMITSSCSSGGGTRQLHLLKVPTIGMTYLSPFSMCTRGDRVISEGNLSSSGYSSMASPGPSRCGSNNPLLPPGEDGGQSPGGGNGGSRAGGPRNGSTTSAATSSSTLPDAIALSVAVTAHQQSTAAAADRMMGTLCSMGAENVSGVRGTSNALTTVSCSSESVANVPLQLPLASTVRHNPRTAHPNHDVAGGGAVGGFLMAQLGPNGKLQHMARRARLRSDSETMSDDMMVMESNDEGIEIDHGNGSGGAEETPERIDDAGMLAKLAANSAAATKALQNNSAKVLETVEAACIEDSDGIVLAVPMMMHKPDEQKPTTNQPLHLSLAEVIAPLRKQQHQQQDELMDEKESATAGWVAAQQLQLPTITLQPCEATTPAGLVADGRSVSQVSSRSESPMR